MEQLNIKAFGMLAEKLEASEFQFPYYQNTKELLDRLKAKYPQLDSQNFSLAVNQQIVRENTALNGNEEIALLPPFSGG
ncbi:MoaD/ThiS family protein [Autumnicola psychrophila]|uniref:MoaD/ThiS family protein n=1 Tax=Autumnicola psychrophila TaxID=3075592 RepID=A0ABU3DSA9_9FLAO|nr:MoaD/ThiS family protein [Zunongwangia sp. F225]MDT0686611.1 MoaD/ThiS family protein [Zunongwangia sp. F225]